MSNEKEDNYRIYIKKNCEESLEYDLLLTQLQVFNEASGGSVYLSLNGGITELIEELQKVKEYFKM